MPTANEFRFLQIYSSHMVLQREKPIVFQGTADPNGEVTLQFNGRTETVCADGEGYWLASFPAMEAGGPYTATLSGAPGKASVILEDLLVGEVWICTGQSNMEMPVWSELPFWRTLNAAEEVKNANHPQIRLFQLPSSGISPYVPLRDLTTGEWQICTPDTVKSFSACGYFFGRKLQQDLKVPVGLINVSWGGTFIEAWISGRKLKEYNWTAPQDQAGDVVANWRALAESEQCRELRQWLKEFDAQSPVLPDAAELAADFDDGDWEPVQDRCVYHLGREIARLSFELDPAFAGQPATLKMSNVNDMDRSYCNGTFIGATGLETSNYWDELRTYPIPAGVLRAGKNVIAVVEDNHYSTGLLPDCHFSLVFAGKEQKIRAAAKRKVRFTLPSSFPCRPPAPSLAVRHEGTPHYPSTLFNARVAPWTKFPMRGTIWYQGCNNNGEFTYYPLHKMLIDDFREQFQNPDFAFLLVQLAAYQMAHPEYPYTAEEIAAFPVPEYSQYAVTREIQAEMPHCRPLVGMVSAFDRGDAADIHPRDKQTIGARLAQKAEAMVYQMPSCCDSPELDYFRIENDKVRLFFRNVGSGLTTCDGKAPKGFRIGDGTGSMFEAEAAIEGDTVVVSAPGVPHPQRVRYAFTGYCEVNLCSKEGLPVLPFRTDKPDYAAMFANVR